jgi:hypothetical protein
MYGGQRELPAELTELAEPAPAGDRDDREPALLDDRLHRSPSDCINSWRLFTLICLFIKSPPAVLDGW